MVLFGKNKKQKKRAGEVSAWRLMFKTWSGKIGIVMLIIFVLLGVGAVVYYKPSGMKQYEQSSVWPYLYPSAVPPGWAVSKAPMKIADLSDAKVTVKITKKVVYPDPKAVPILQYIVNNYNDTEIYEKYVIEFNYKAEEGALPNDVYYGLIVNVSKNAVMYVGNNQSSYLIQVISYLERPDGIKVVLYDNQLSINKPGEQVIYAAIIQGNNNKTLIFPQSLNNVPQESPLSQILQANTQPILNKIKQETGKTPALRYGQLLFATARDGRIETLNGKYKFVLEIYYFVNDTEVTREATGGANVLNYVKPDARVYPAFYQLKVMPNYWGFFGTDGMGRPIGLGLLYGIPYAFLIGFLVTFTSTFIGAIYGVIAGYYKDIRGEAMMRVVDVVNSLPFLPILIALSVALKTINLLLLAVLMIILFWAGPVIIVRSMALQISEQVYVEAARAVGAGTRRIILKHMFPQVFPYTMAIAVLSIPGIIVTEASLAVLGFGDPSAPTWGKMLQYAFDAGAVSNGWWWVVLFPGLALVLFSATFLLIGRAMEPLVAPKLVK